MDSTFPIDRNLECIVWCPQCKEVKFKVIRNEVSPGIYTNKRVPEIKNHKFCECGTQLERQ